MTGTPLLDGAIIAVSLFNAMTLTWLGLTVLLNSDRRAWGIWLGSFGLLMGGVFFVSHTAILSLGVFNLGWNMIFWWTVGLVPAIMLPFLWYVVVLWYAGYWEDGRSALHRRQRPWFYLIILMLLVGLAGLAVGIMLLALPRTLFSSLRLFIRWSLFGIPLLVLGYSLYVILCIGLSLDALRRPGPVRRAMGEVARQRARPWLTAVSLTLLLVSLLVIAVLGWVVQESQHRTMNDIYHQATHLLALADLFIASIVGLAVVMLGQAVVSYEVFTGKTLPRRGLWRQWRRTIIFAAGFSLLVWGSRFFDLRRIYSLLLTAMLIAFFYAFFSWRAYQERDRYIDSLRPFITSQRLYDSLLTKSPPVFVDVQEPFRALCAEVLDAQVAYLVAVGPLAPLVGPALVYPATAVSPANATPFPLADVTTHLTNRLSRQMHQSDPAAHDPALLLDPAQFHGLVWAVPLWSERGLIGMFLLGRKRGNGLYTQEEIEIARVSGERLIDTCASAEMARRLMALQRERLTTTQIVDQQTRRVLHDDILPEIQMAIIKLGSQATTNEAIGEAVESLTRTHKQISNLLHDIPTTKAPEVARLGLVEALRQAVTQEFAPAFDEVVWQVAETAVVQAKAIPPRTAEVIFYAAREVVRNAAKYGRGIAAKGESVARERPFQISLTITWADTLQLTIEDNGVGLAAETAQGNGQGLALHSTMMAVIGGELAIESVPGQFTRVNITWPTPR